MNLAFSAVGSTRDEKCRTCLSAAFSPPSPSTPTVGTTCGVCVGAALMHTDRISEQRTQHTRSEDELHACAVQLGCECSRQERQQRRLAAGGSPHLVGAKESHVLQELAVRGVLTVGHQMHAERALAVHVERLALHLIRPAGGHEADDLWHRSKRLVTRRPIKCTLHGVTTGPGGIHRHRCCHGNNTVGGSVLASSTPLSCAYACMPEKLALKNGNVSLHRWAAAGCSDTGSSSRGSYQSRGDELAGPMSVGVYRLQACGGGLTRGIPTGQHAPVLRPGRL
jgi:hypothetical protein